MGSLYDDLEPISVQEALFCPNSNEWNDAVGEELESLRENHVWDFVDLPPERRAIGNKWILKIKCKADESIDRYKARLIAKGYTQYEGIDYEEMFSHVVRFNMLDCNPIDTPIAKGEGLSLNMCPKTDNGKKEMKGVPYSSAIGIVMYAMMCTRPDICYAVGLVSRNDLHLTGYTDAKWAGDLDERRSTSRYDFLLSGGAITWSSKK
ncbi:unnamed protein product [Microthlaspi erraticum]|uniref:Reverse transcriptase Ty1/copia-type domain-containing protein n=1 Tax=Microthlaspi erraticum TaxID=1685480 RepID=A0A6D2J5V5_9BRAS|nr:unnamed protein product [Microthlaspi erraticum]